MEPTAIEPIRKQRLAQRVAESLRQLIVAQGLEAGQRLPPERDLASALAVSRHVVREALRQLELQGDIVTSHGNGTFVQRRIEASERGSSRDDAVYRTRHEARAVFEAGLADLIVERATDADIAELSRIVGEMRSRVLDSRPAGTEDVQFHEQLLRCTRNDELIRIGRPLIMGYLHDRLIGMGAELVYAPEGVDVEPHEAILAALQRRDPVALRHCLLRHGYAPDPNS